MLSILIPVFNRDCTELLEALVLQGRQLSVPFEVRLYDDGSKSDFKNIQQLFCQKYPEIVYREMPVNLGRAKLRNLLAAEAKYELLVFMDCDAGMVRSDFLSVYLNCFLENENELFVGGTFYSPNEPQNPLYRLHWKYGVQREIRSKGFKTFNFAISKSMFALVGGFDERLMQYGHEDTMFGIAVGKLGKKWSPIDNPLEHLGLEKADVFIEKSLRAIESMLQISKFEPSIKEHIGMLKLVENLENLHLDSFVRQLIHPFMPFLRRILEGGTTNLLLFDVFRLYHIIKNKK